MSELLAKRLVDLLERFSAEIDEELLSDLEALYDPEVVFSDPIQTIHGREAFTAMNRKLVSRARSCRFQVTAWATRGEQIFLAWTLDYVPRRGPALSFDGTSLLDLRDGLVISHRDYWDLAGSMLDAVPGVGSIYRRLVAHLG